MGKKRSLAVISVRAPIRAAYAANIPKEGGW